MGNAYSILEGVIDLHVHGNTDLYAPPFDEIEISQKAKDVGYRGILCKSHHTVNADRPYILNKVVFLGPLVRGGDFFHVNIESRENQPGEGLYYLRHHHLKAVQGIWGCQLVASSCDHLGWL